MKKANKGFTLAEVLITLGIIGVVAAMTIPTLMLKYEKAQTIVQLKKVYALLSNASTQALSENSGDMGFTGDEAGDNKIIHDDIMSKLKYVSYCTHASYNETCAFEGIAYKDVAATNRSCGVDKASAGSESYILADGTFIAFSPFLWGPNNSLIKIDINGGRGPNKNGQDLFVMNIYKKKIIAPGQDINNNGCNSDSGGDCFRKIFNDGWQIKEDYPW